MTTFHLQIATMDGNVFDGQVQSVSCRTIHGDLAILARHMNYCTAIGMGTAHVVLEDGTERKAACIGGMLTMMNGECRLIPTTWEWSEDIDVARAEKAKKLADKIYLMDVVAPRVAANCLPGQFIIAKVDKEGERIPLTICDYDRENGTITIVFQIVGASTEKMSKLVAGDSFTDFVGPLGVASEFTKEDPEALKNKKFLFVAGGVGAAPVYPQVKWLHEHGIQADVIVGAKTQSLILLEEEMKAVGNVYITTDDGSYERKGMVTQVIQELHDQGKQYDVCVAIGPMIMMKFVCKLTKELGIPTIVSLNPIMVDGTGMCGGCRVSVGGEIKFACVDGPEFDGHLVNWDEAMMRQQTYKTAEGRAMLKELEGETHHGGCGHCEG